MSKEDMDEDGFELTDDSGDDLTDCESDSEISTLIRQVSQFSIGYRWVEFSGRSDRGNVHRFYIFKVSSYSGGLIDWSHLLIEFA